MIYSKEQKQNKILKGSSNATGENFFSAYYQMVIKELSVNNGCCGYVFFNSDWLFDGTRI